MEPTSPKRKSQADQKAMARERLGRLEAVLAGKKRLLILTHKNPDPDSIASAMALRFLVRQRFHLKAEVYFGGMIGRAENQALVRLLHLDMQEMEHASIRRHDAIAVVDCQPLAGNSPLPRTEQATIVIDHHTPRPRLLRNIPFLDLRQEFGATTTLLWEYLQAANLRPDRTLATAMFYGIKSETLNLSRDATHADIEAYGALFEAASRSVIARIEQARLPAGYYTLLKIATQRALVFGGTTLLTSFRHLDVPDRVPEFADFFARLENMRCVAVFGEYEGSLYLSLRTSSRGPDAAKLIRKLVRKIGDGGGHPRMAGGQVPLQPEKNFTFSTATTLLKKRLLEALHQTTTKHRPIGEGSLLVR